MAEIKIEKKKPVWPWILLLLGLIALVYFLFFRDREAERDVIEEVDAQTSVIDTPGANDIAAIENTAIYTTIS